MKSRIRIFFINQEAKKNTEEDLKVINTGTPIIDQEDYIPGSRKKKIGLISKIPVYNNKNEIFAIIGFFIDITERIKNEKIRYLLDISLKNSSDVVCLKETHPKEKFVYVSGSVENLFGYSPECFYKDPTFLENICLHSDSKAELELRKRHKIVSELKVYKVITSDNEIKWVEVSTFKKNLFSEKYIGYILRDVTANKKKKEKDRETIKEMTKFYEGMAVNPNLFFWVGMYDNKENINIINLSRNISNLTGYSKEDIISGKKKMLSIVDHEHRIMFEQWFKKDNLPVEFQHKVKCADKSTKWFNSSISMNEINGEDIVCGLHTDITESKMLDDELKNF